MNAHNLACLEVPTPGCQSLYLRADMNIHQSSLSMGVSSGVSRSSFLLHLFLLLPLSASASASASRLPAFVAVIVTLSSLAFSSPPPIFPQAEAENTTASAPSQTADIIFRNACRELFSLRPDAALPLLEECLRLQPRCPDFRLARLQALAELQRWEGRSMCVCAFAWLGFASVAHTRRGVSGNLAVQPRPDT